MSVNPTTGGDRHLRGDATLERSGESAERSSRRARLVGDPAGDWYHASLPHSLESSGPLAWPKSLGFVSGYYDPSAVRVSIGGTIAPPGVWTIPDDAPRPVDVSVASGTVRYRPLYTEGRTQSGLMLVRMDAPDSILVEVFPGPDVAHAEFDAAAQVYVR